MIKVNGIKIEREHFPDLTQRIKLEEVFFSGSSTPNFQISWKYECDEELVTLIFVVKHIRNIIKGASIHLLMPYVPNARMDRIHHSNEVFTLKYFCDIINSLNLDSVRVLDVHSHVAEALLNNVVLDGIEGIMELVIGKLPTKPVMYFPDAGAMKRYESIAKNFGCKVIYGQKKRNWDTGQIEGLSIKTDSSENVEELVKDNVILMIDDIISYGGTMFYSAKELKTMGAKNIYAYATHTENSVLDKEKGTFIKCLEDGTVDQLFTTNSIYRGNHDKITCFIA